MDLLHLFLAINAHITRTNKLKNFHLKCAAIRIQLWMKCNCLCGNCLARCVYLPIYLTERYTTNSLFHISRNINLHKYTKCMTNSSCTLFQSVRIYGILAVVVVAICVLRCEPFRSCTFLCNSIIPGCRCRHCVVLWVSTEYETIMISIAANENNLHYFSFEIIIIKTEC